MEKESIWIGIGITAVVIVLAVFLIFGTSSRIVDIKSEDYVGKTVAVRGIVQNTIKIGALSGYTLKDDTDTISISSEQLPKEGDSIKVRGTLMHDTLFGYYIKVS